MLFRTSLLALLFCLPACKPMDSAYPSLAKRPIEAQAVPQVAPATASDQPAADALDAQSQARVDAAESASQAADHDFQAALPAARAMVSKAGEAGSEPWVQAQQAVSALEADRARGRSGLADLDQLARDLLASQDPAKLGRAPAVTAAAARIQARNDAQSATLSDLEAKLPGS